MNQKMLSKLQRVLPAFIAVLALANPTAYALAGEQELDPEREAKTTFLDEEKVKNLGIEAEPVFAEQFESTIFALGRIQSLPSRHGVVSSRISGRVVELSVHEGDQVIANQSVAKIESRQPGDPPPRVDLKAPITGLVTHSHVKLGEPVEPSMEILDIVDLSEVYAVARIPEDQASKIGPGTKARITVPALGGEIFEGEMIRFGTSADIDSGTVDAVFLLPNPSGRLRPNMRAEFAFIISSRENVLFVPKEAIQGDMANRVVYVQDFDFDHAFIKAPVQLGEQNDQGVEIVSGIFEGDSVVVKGAYMLSHSKEDGLSLKEALDMAHGHEHNEDGSEMTAEQQAAAAEEKAAARGEAVGSNAQVNQFLVLSNVILLGLLVLVGMNRVTGGRGAIEDEGTAAEGEEVKVETGTEPAGDA